MLVAPVRLDAERRRVVRLAEPARELPPAEGLASRFSARSKSRASALADVAPGLLSQFGERFVRSIERLGQSLRAAAGVTPNGVYIHDRRSGNRVEIVSVDCGPLDRHAADELYGIALGAGLDADVTMIHRGSAARCRQR